MVDKSVLVDGVQLNYSLDGQGYPLMVIGSSIYYPRTFSRAVKARYRWVFVDMPHFVSCGDPAALPQWDFEFYCRCIEAVRARLGYGRMAVLGHSHHGNLALEYAKRYPQRVSHLIMIGSPPVDIAGTIAASSGYWESHASRERKQVLAQRRELLGNRLAQLAPMEAYIAQYVADAPLYWYDPNHDAASLWRGMQFTMEAVGKFRSLYTQYRMHWDVNTLKAPVMVIMGRHDYAVPHILWDEAKPSLPGVRYHLFEKSGHTPQLEEPDLFAQTLLEWLNSSQCVTDRFILPDY